MKRTMKRPVITLILLVIAINVLQGQTKNEIESLFNRIADQGDNFKFSISHDLISDLDFDFDFNNYTEEISGRIDRIRFLKFDNYRRGLKSEKEFIEQMLHWGYRQANIPSDWHDDEPGQVILLRKPNGQKSDNAAILLNDPGDRTAILIVFSGDLIFKTN